MRVVSYVGVCCCCCDGAAVSRWVGGWLIRWMGEGRFVRGCVLLLLLLLLPRGICLPLLYES